MPYFVFQFVPGSLFVKLQTTATTTPFPFVKQKTYTIRCRHLLPQTLFVEPWNQVANAHHHHLTRTKHGDISIANPHHHHLALRSNSFPLYYRAIFDFVTFCFVKLIGPGQQPRRRPQASLRHRRLAHARPGDRTPGCGHLQPRRVAQAAVRARQTLILTTRVSMNNKYKIRQNDVFCPFFSF